MHTPSIHVVIKLASAIGSSKYNVVLFVFVEFFRSKCKNSFYVLDVANEFERNLTQIYLYGIAFRHRLKLHLLVRSIT